MSKRKAKAPWLRLASSNGQATTPQRGIAVNIKMPLDEKVVVKEVPAKVDGIVVGTAEIYEDGTVGVRIDDDAPQWAKDKINSTADELGFEIGTDI